MPGRPGLGGEEARGCRCTGPAGRRSPGRGGASRRLAQAWVPFPLQPPPHWLFCFTSSLASSPQHPKPQQVTSLQYTLLWLLTSFGMHSGLPPLALTPTRPLPTRLRMSLTCLGTALLLPLLQPHHPICSSWAQGICTCHFGKVSPTSLTPFEAQPPVLSSLAKLACDLHRCVTGIHFTL